jgi:photosystem II stability/assembly factor-like uncharacterized protein
VDADAVDGEISVFSSGGPTRDGRTKPEITAPGERVLGAVSRDAYPGEAAGSIYQYRPLSWPIDALITDVDTAADHRFGVLQGTSFAAPVVTGLVARILSENPGLDAVEVRNVLVNSAVVDAFVTSGGTKKVPNPAWGYGKADEGVGESPLPPDLRILTDSLPNGVRHAQYNQVLTASGGTLPYSWYVTAGSLPPGMRLEAGGFLTGKTTVDGTYTFTITATDTSLPQQSDSQPYELVIMTRPNLKVMTHQLPAGRLDKAYAGRLEAEGGTPPYVWALAGGSLPAGLALGADGRITGTPTLVGKSSFTVTVQDASAETAKRNLKITIATETGGEWTPLGTNQAEVTHLAVDPANPDHALAATSNPFGVFETTNGGESWRAISVNSGMISPVSQLAIQPGTSTPWLIGSAVQRFNHAVGGWTSLGSECMSIWSPGLGIALFDTNKVLRVQVMLDNFMACRPAFYSNDNGQTWTTASRWDGPTNIGAYLLGGSVSLYGNDSRIAYAATSGDYDHRTNFTPDGGVTWFDIRNGSPGKSTIRVSQQDPLDVFKAAMGDISSVHPAGPKDDGSVWRSLDGGRNWSQTTRPATGSFWAFERGDSVPSRLYVGGSPGLFRSDDAGQSWQSLRIDGRTDPVKAVAVYSQDADIVYAAVSGRGVFRSSDGGQTWVARNQGLRLRPLDGVAISGAEPLDVMVYSGGTVFVSRNGGIRWTTAGNGLVGSVTRIVPSASTRLLSYVSSWNGLFRSANGGVTWEQPNPSQTWGIKAFDVDPTDGNVVLAGMSGTRGTYRSNDRGTTWTPVFADLPYYEPRDLRFARDVAGRAYLSFEAGGIYRSENQGTNWAPFGLNDKTVQYLMPAPSNSEYVYAFVPASALPEMMYFLDPAVGTWTAATTMPARPVLCAPAVDALDPMVAYVGADHPGSVGATGGIYKTTDGGRNWARLPGTLDAYDVLSVVAHPSQSGIVYVATREFGAFRSEDGGLTWTALDTYGTVGDLANVNVQDPSNPYLLFAGTEGYGVQASTDRGRTYAPRVNGLGNLYVNAIAFDPETPSTLYAATDGGVFKTTDAATTWTTTGLVTGEITDLAAVNSGSGRLIWATVRGQGVGFSSNGGQTFTVSSSGLSSLELTSVHVEVTGTGRRIWATMRGADGVAYSTDDGATWVSASGNGLTDRDVNSLAIQGSGRRIWAAGEEGAGRLIWAMTDSGVYYSRDDGLSWSEHSLGLPSGVPATSAAIDPNTDELLVSLYSPEGGGVYRGGNISGLWSAFNAGLDELRVKRLTRDAGRVVGASTRATTFYAATSGAGVYAAEVRTTEGAGPTIGNVRLAQGLLRRAYADTLVATGGAAPYVWSVPAGSLPAGISLDAATGVLSGEPSALGLSLFTVQVADANAGVTQKELSILVVSPDELNLTHVSPGSGVRGTGLTVSVYGSGFSPGAAVSFGAGVTVGSVTVVSPDELSVGLTIEGDATPGYRGVTVTLSGGGSVTLADVFKVEYPTPVVTSVSPGEVSRKATVRLTVRGDHFEAGAVADFGAGVGASATQWVSASELTVDVTVSEGAAVGARALVLTNPNGLSATLADALTVRLAAPTVTSVGPAQSNQGATLGLTVLGTDFASGAAVSFGDGVTVNSVSFVSSSQLSVNVTVSPVAGLGYRTVTVTNGDGQSGSMTNGFRVMGPSPQVLSVQPDTGDRGESLSVDVNGVNFQSGATVILGGTGVTVQSTTLLTGTKLRLGLVIDAGAALGGRNVTVCNLDGQCATHASGFVVKAPAPTLSSVSPGYGGRGASVSVALGGTNFLSGATASFGAGVSVGATTYVSGTELRASVTVDGVAALGARTVTVTNPDGKTVSLPDAFEVKDTPPVLASVAPWKGSSGESASVVLKGTGFLVGATVDFGAGITVEGLSTSPIQVTAMLSIAGEAAKGARDVTVTNPDGQASTLAGAFTVLTTPYVALPVGYAWIDASGGTDTGITGDDAGATIPIGFPFTFYGVPRSEVTVSSNGYLTFGGAGDRYLNTPLPDASAPNAVIAAYWDDLAPTGPGQVRYSVLGAAGDRSLVVQWSGVGRLGAPGTVTFQVALHEKGNRIVLQYQDVGFGDPDVDGGASASVGIEDETGASGLLLGHDTAFLENERAYLLTNLAALAVTRTGDGGVTSAPTGIDCGGDCHETYATGTEVTLTAAPSAGHEFGGWGGACSGSALTCAVTVDGAKGVSAAFTPLPSEEFALAVTRTGAAAALGRVTSSPAGIDCGDDCAQEYAAGTVVTLTASASGGAVFSGWGGACSGSAVACDVKMDAARSVSAEFVPTASGGGFYTVTPCRAVDTRDGAKGGPGPLVGGTDTSFSLAGVCGIPASAVAVSVNVTAAQPDAGGHVRVYAAGTPRPTASVVNYVSGQTRANNAIVAPGTDGKITVYVSQAAGAVHVIVDVNGYFE